MTKDELIALLGNCILACALSNDPDILRDAHEAADKHVRELDARFPDWKNDLYDS